MNHIVLKIYFKNLTMNGEIIHISIKIILKNSHLEWNKLRQYKNLWRIQMIKNSFERKIYKETKYFEKKNYINIKSFDYKIITMIFKKSLVTSYF